MFSKKDLFALLVLIGIFVLICFLTSLPPHTDPGVQVLEPGIARVHNSETLVLWVPYGKSSAKYSFTYLDGVVTGSSFLYHDQRTIREGCETFSVALFYKVEACREDNDMIFKWNEVFLGVRIDR